MRVCACVVCFKETTKRSPPRWFVCVCVLVALLAYSTETLHPEPAEAFRAPSGGGAPGHWGTRILFVQEPGVWGRHAPCPWCPVMPRRKGWGVPPLAWKHRLPQTHTHTHTHTHAHTHTHPPPTGPVGRRSSWRRRRWRRAFRAAAPACGHHCGAARLPARPGARGALPAVPGGAGRQLQPRRVGDRHVSSYSRGVCG